MSPSDWQCAGRRWAIPCKICVYWIANASVSRLRLRLLCVHRFAARCWRSATLCLKIFCLAPLRKHSECFEKFLCVKNVLNATKIFFLIFRLCYTKLYAKKMLAGSYCAPVTRALPFFALKLTFKTKTQLGCKATVFFRKTFENFFFEGLVCALLMRNTTS